MPAQNRKNRHASKSTRPVEAVDLLHRAKIDLHQIPQGRPLQTRSCATGRPQSRRSASGRSQSAVLRFGAPLNRAPLPAPSMWTVARLCMADTGPPQRRRKSLPRNRRCATGRVQWSHGASAIP